MTRVNRNNFAPLIRLRGEQCAIAGQQVLMLSLIEDWKKAQYYNIPVTLVGLYHAAIGYSYDISWAMKMALICFDSCVVLSLISNLYQINKGKCTKYSFVNSVWFYLLIIVSLALIPLYLMDRHTSTISLLKQQIIPVLICYLLNIMLFVYHHYQYHMLEERRLKYQCKYDDAVDWFQLSHRGVR